MGYNTYNITNNGIKEPTQVVPNYNASQIQIFGGYHKVRESLFTFVVIWVNTILNLLILGWLYLCTKIHGWYIDVNDINNKNILKYPHPNEYNFWFSCILM